MAQLLACRTSARSSLSDRVTKERKPVAAVLVSLSRTFGCRTNNIR